MKKYGYVIEMRKTSSHHPGFFGFNGNYAGPLRSASVFNRRKAYYLRATDETVRKVELFKNGKPKKIVPMRG